MGKSLLFSFFYDNNNDNGKENNDDTDNDNWNFDVIGKSILVCEDSIPEDLFLSAHFSTWLPYSVGNSAKKFWK